MRENAYSPDRRSSDALNAARLRWLAARTGSVVAKAGYLALAEAIEKSCAADG